MPMSRRPIAFLLLAWYLPACSSYQTTALAPQEAVHGQETVKVVLADTALTELVLRTPWVRTDSIGGVPCPSGRCSVGTAWSVPLDSVVAIKTKQSAPGLTALAVIGGVALFAAAIAVAAATENALNEPVW